MKPVLLIVMDGWGINPRKDGNATALADTPNLDRLGSIYPSTRLVASGFAVGLPDGQMGNSEVGHLTLGSGRVIFQELTRINKSIEDGDFYEHPALNTMLLNVKERGGALHLMGLLSDGGVHSHIRHLYAILEAAGKAGVERVFVHAFLDGRDTPPESGRGYVENLLKKMKETGVGRIATISGRYYAMDRDRRWDRIKRVYDAMVLGAGKREEDPVAAVENAYRRRQTDEFIEPIIITSNGRPTATVCDGDSIIFFNFRADRARELTRAFIEDDFPGFDRKKRPRPLNFLTMTEYDASFNVPVLFPPQELRNILGEVLCKNGVRQFRVAETEKYAHVTFFFNGGEEKPFEGEERLLIPSARDVATYDQRPEMKASEIADAAVERLEEGGFGFMLVNFANGDMVGHTGVLDAAIKACEAVDASVGRVVDAALKEGWAVIITSDHGNAEQMTDYETGEPYTAHTTNPVPFILVDEGSMGREIRQGGLSDVAPTVLKVMGLGIPVDMGGKPLV